MTAKRSRVRRFALAVTVTSVMALIALLVPTLAFTPLTKSPPAAAGVRAVGGKLTTVPASSETVRRALKAELSGLISKLYTHAFTTAPVTDSIGGAPRPKGIDGARTFFTQRARASLRAHAGVFDPAGVDIRSGRVFFAGVATLSGTLPTSALVSIDFEATGTAPESRGEVSVKQKGSLLLKRTAAGWRVAGFDLALRASPVTTS